MKGAAGVRILSEAAAIVRAAGFEIGNVSVQLVGNRPKFSPRRDEATRVLSEAAGAPVTVIATTRRESARPVLNEAGAVHRRVARQRGGDFPVAC